MFVHWETATLQRDKPNLLRSHVGFLSIQAMNRVILWEVFGIHSGNEIPYVYIYMHILVGGLEHEFYFPYIGNSHPN